MSNNGLVKSEILCPEVWGEDEFTVYLPPVYTDDQIHLSFTINDFGKIEGLFDVADHLHIYNSETGYVQRVVLNPLD